MDYCEVVEVPAKIRPQICQFQFLPPITLCSCFHKGAPQFLALPSSFLWLHSTGNSGLPKHLDGLGILTFFFMKISEFRKHKPIIRIQVKRLAKLSGGFIQVASGTEDDRR